MIDLRNQLVRSKKVAQVNRKTTGYITLHYNGGSVKSIPNDIDLLKGDARFHVQTRGWDGLSYAIAIGRNGAVYQTRDYMARLNHAGVPFANSEALPIFICAGEGDILPEAQTKALENTIKELGCSPRFVFGHQESPRMTSCPGAQLIRWIRNYRACCLEVLAKTHTLFNANVRDESNVLSHLVKTLPAKTNLTGMWFLGHPYKGDSLWFCITGTNDFLHGSVLDTTNAPEWARNKPKFNLGR